MNVTVKNLPLSGVIKVFSKSEHKTIFDGTEDNIPEIIGNMIPELIYSVNDVLYIDVK